MSIHGIRLAIGARESQVLVQFPVEATVLSAIGGFIGIMPGLGLAALGVANLGENGGAKFVHGSGGVARCGRRKVVHLCPSSGL